MSIRVRGARKRRAWPRVQRGRRPLMRACIAKAPTCAGTNTRRRPIGRAPRADSAPTRRRRKMNSHDKRMPDPADMQTMIDTRFRNSVHGLIELAWTTPAPGTKERVKLNNAQLFGLGDDERDALVEFACELNARPDTNVYISAGLRREDVDRRRRHGADALLSVAALKAD